jgi:hypothetical protein
LRLGADGRDESIMVRTPDGRGIKKHVVLGEGNVVAAIR